MRATAETASVEDLIRVILERRPVQNDALEDGSNDGSAEEIIFDLEIDGFRYLFIRQPKSGQLPIQLSPREREIVRLVALGHSNKIIADILNISCWTVCTHLRRVFAKLGVGSRAAMVAHLAKTGRPGAGTWGAPNEDRPDGAANVIRHIEPDSQRKPITRGDNPRRVCV
jgi:DNA-binding CsgD family transcriptional regulator